VTRAVEVEFAVEWDVFRFHGQVEAFPAPVKKSEAFPIVHRNGMLSS
jgi:hypothetical protein